MIPLHRRTDPDVEPIPFPAASPAKQEALAPLVDPTNPSKQADAPADPAPRKRSFPIKPTVLARITVAVALLAVGVYYVYENGIRLVGTEGVVTAPLMTVRAPIEGHVEESHVAIGMRVSAGEPLFLIRDRRSDDRLLNQLLTNRQTYARQVEALDTQITTLLAEANNIDQWIRGYDQAAVGRLTQIVRETEAELSGAEAVVKRATADQRRTASLAAGGHVARSRLDESNALLGQAQARVAALRATIERRHVELDAAHRGVNVVDGYGDIPSARQRVQEISIRISDLRTQRAFANASMEEMDARFLAEDARLKRATEARLAAPANGIVWNVVAAAGSDVVPSQPLADIALCSAAVVEGKIAESRYGEVAIGARARVQLKGSSLWLNGEVRSVRGAGAYVEKQPRAAHVEREAYGLMTVVVALLPGEALKGDAQGCPIGRTARVRFD
jgi:multidrug resistance efflux pump